MAEQPSSTTGGVGNERTENGAQRRVESVDLDGWWAEAFNGSNGFAIGNGTRHVSDEITDQRDALSLYDVLESEVIPMFYHRDNDGLPREWVKRMMNSIATLGWRFSSDRMVMDYTTHCYVPSAGGLSCDVPAVDSSMMLIEAANFRGNTPNRWQLKLTAQAKEASSQTLDLRCDTSFLCATGSASAELTFFGTPHKTVGTDSSHSRERGNRLRECREM